MCLEYRPAAPPSREGPFPEIVTRPSRSCLFFVSVSVSVSYSSFVRFPSGGNLEVALLAGLEATRLVIPLISRGVLSSIAKHAPYRRDNALMGEPPPQLRGTGNGARVRGIRSESRRGAVL